jgi:hypothetical protein
MTFSGWVATLAGWYVTEIGRQPFIVYGVLRTADVVASHGATMVAATLAAWLVLYAGLLVAYVAVLKHMAEHPAMPAHAPEAARFAHGHWPSPPEGHFMTYLELRRAADLHGGDGAGPAGLCGAGRLRPGRGHPAALGHGDAERRHGVQHRPVLGRQRNLAGAGRRRAAGGVPAGAWRGAERVVPAGGADAGGPDAARRGVRLPRQGACQPQGAVECAVCRRLAGQQHGPGLDAGQLPHRL